MRWLVSQIVMEYMGAGSLADMLEICELTLSEEQSTLHYRRSASAQLLSLVQSRL
jgi:hypothetical protein